MITDRLEVSVSRAQQTFTHASNADSGQRDFFERHRYLVAKSILSKEFLSFLESYYSICNDTGRFVPDDQCPLSRSLGHDRGFDAILDWLCPKIENLIGAQLAPTYSYTRIYGKGDILRRHRDRAACEVSVTICIKIPPKYETSPLYFKAKNSEVVQVLLSEGDGCIYSGAELEHWRDPFASSGFAQLFLHYIRKSGPLYPTHLYDGRACLGASKAPRQYKIEK